MTTIREIETFTAPRALTTDEIEGAAPRELSTAELDAVAGGSVEILVYAAASTYAYYRYLKWADKI